jgi:tetratricopeptide (TPR) repeat protein
MVLRLCSFDAHSCDSRIWFGATFKEIAGTAVLAAAVWLSASIHAATGPQTSSQVQVEESAAIRGDVVSANGRPVEGATVQVRKQGSSTAIEVKSDAGGVFHLSDLVPGTYVLSAQSQELRSSDKVVAASGNSENRVVLVLVPQDGQKSTNAAANQFAEAMEFADNPSFSVAGVTDWTAAGGHGSDVSLRASEALVRETIRLDADAPGSNGTHRDMTAKGPRSGDSPAELSKKESDLRAALVAAPDSFQANRAVGEFYLAAQRYREALDPLKTCFRIDPADHANERDLALTLKETGDFVQARAHIESLLSHGEDAELHRLAGEVEEGLGDPMAALSEFEKAARLDPSEENFFAWGSELLLHRAILQAREVFARGAKAYPGSIRMLTALGAVLFSSALYDKAALRLCEASDLDPGYTEPYLFMGRIVVAAPNPLPCVTQRLARFLEREPENPLANYFYAMATWKQNGKPDELPEAAPVEALLNRAVALDAKCADAWLQLGALSYARHDYGKAIGFFQKALEADPRMSEAHYKLGIAYDRTGDHQKAREEFALHDQIDKQQKEEVEEQRREIKQFRVIEQGQLPGRSQQP